MGAAWRVKLIRRAVRQVDELSNGARRDCLDPIEELRTGDFEDRALSAQNRGDLRRPLRKQLRGGDGIDGDRFAVRTCIRIRSKARPGESPCPGYSAELTRRSDCCPPARGTLPAGRTAA